MILNFAALAPPPLLSVAKIGDPRKVAKECLPMMVYWLIHDSDNLLADGGDHLTVS